MELYLLRHGIAHESAPDDASRELTSEGRAKVREVLKMARRAGVRPQAVASSPYVRALQTARIAAEVLGYLEPVDEWPDLVPSGDARTVWQQVRERRACAALLLAGHQPLFADLGAFLLASPALRIDFKKAALLALDIPAFGPEPRAVLRWMLTPRLAG